MNLQPPPFVALLGSRRVGTMYGLEAARFDKTTRKIGNYFDGLTQSEISAWTGSPLGKVKVPHWLALECGLGRDICRAAKGMVKAIEVEIQDALECVYIEHSSRDNSVGFPKIHMSLDNHLAGSSQSAELAALFCLGALPAGELEEFNRHLARCLTCRENVDLYSKLLGAWAESSQAKLPPGARERFFRRLKKQDAQGKAHLSVLLNRRGVLISRSSAMEWQPGPVPGIWVKSLSRDSERGYETSLVRFDPGIQYPGHRHTNVEEAYVLSGDLEVEGTVLRIGDYCRSEPNSTHTESGTIEGCLLLVIASQRDELPG